MKCPKNIKISCPYWELPYSEMDTKQTIIYQFKEYLIEHFYLSQSTADDVYSRYLEVDSGK
jgi:hypothetical protein